VITFTTKCPTRIDLAGGTLDLWPIWAMIEKCSTINVSISVYTSCEIKEREDTSIHIDSPDMKKKWVFTNKEELYSSSDDSVLFFKAHIAHWNPSKGFEITTRSESPVGGGLGGSSSLSVAIYKTFEKWLKTPEKNIHEMVRECSNIEAMVLATPTGLQDYYGAASQGLNLIDFSTRGVDLQKSSEHACVFNNSVIIVYTGKSHHSGINNWGVLKKFIDKDEKTIEALHQLRDVAQKMRLACAQQSWGELPALFTQDFDAREMLSEEFMSPEIRELKKIADAAGAIGFKICGAGGGGCVAVWCPPDQRKKIQQTITESSYTVIDATFL
jgi:D-glycero-alpha-D-manno-heptose-7-phosphate kinase